MKLYNAFYEHVCSSNNNDSINVLNKRKIPLFLRTRYPKEPCYCSLLRASHLTKALSLFEGELVFGASWF